MAAVDILSEFLETALHSVLYLRGLYPAAVFRRRQKYTVPVQMAVHREVSAYVAGAVRALRPYLQQRLLREVSVVVLDAAGRPAETVRLQVAVLDAAAAGVPGDPQLVQLETALAGLLLTLYSALPSLPPPAGDATFRLYASVSRSLPESLDAGAEFPLTLAVGDGDAAEGEEDGHVLPIRSVRNQLFSLQVSVRAQAAQG